MVNTLRNLWKLSTTLQDHEHQLDYEVSLLHSGLDLAQDDGPPADPIPDSIQTTETQREVVGHCRKPV